jgi:hypothetical protein
MTANKGYVVGDTVRITLTVRVDDVLTNPGSTTWTIEEPDGTDNAPSNVGVSTGVVRTTFAPDQAGYHRWRAVGTTPASFAREGTFYVYATAIVADS